MARSLSLKVAYPVPPVEPSSRAQAEGSLPFESLTALSLSNGQVE